MLSISHACPWRLHSCPSTLFLLVFAGLFAREVGVVVNGADEESPGKGSEQVDGGEWRSFLKKEVGTPRMRFFWV